MDKLKTIPPVWFYIKNYDYKEKDVYENQGISRVSQ